MSLYPFVSVRLVLTDARRNFNEHSPSRMAKISARCVPATSEDCAASSILASVWDHWDVARIAADGRPSRAAIDPLSLPSAAWRHCFLLDVGPDDFRVRLFGTYMVDLIGRDVTGHWLSALIKDFRNRDSYSAFAAVVREKRAFLWRHQACEAAGKEETLLETLLLPLFGEGGTVAMIYGASVLPSLATVGETGTQPVKDRIRELFVRSRAAGAGADTGPR